MDANRRSEGAEFVSRACSSGLHVKGLTLGLENPGNSGRSDVAKIWGVRVGGDKASKTGHREVVKAPESHVRVWMSFCSWGGAPEKFSQRGLN